MMDNLDILTTKMDKVNKTLAAKAQTLLDAGIPIKNVSDGDIDADAEIDLGEKDGKEYSVQVGNGYETLQMWNEEEQAIMDLADGMEAITKKAKEIFEAGNE